MPDQLPGVNGMHLIANALFGPAAKNQNELQLTVKMLWLAMLLIVAPYGTSRSARQHKVLLKVGLAQAHGPRAYHPDP